MRGAVLLLLLCLVRPARAQTHPTVAEHLVLGDSLYTAARAYGEAAVRVNPAGADGHFTVGQALGRLSRTKGGKERVRFAKIIYDEGMKAIELDSTHDGAYHLVGAWHAEVKR